MRNALQEPNKYKATVPAPKGPGFHPGKWQIDFFKGKSLVAPPFSGGQKMVVLSQYDVEYLTL